MLSIWRTFKDVGALAWSVKVCGFEYSLLGYLLGDLLLWQLNAKSIDTAVFAISFTLENLIMNTFPIFSFQVLRDFPQLELLFVLSWAFLLVVRANAIG